MGETSRTGGGLDAGEQQARDPVRLEGRLRKGLRHAQHGRVLEEQRQYGASGGEVPLAQPVAQLGGEAAQGEAHGADPVERRLEAAPASTRSGRRRGTIGRGSWPRARAWSRSPAGPNWAPTAERGRSASWRHGRQPEEREALARGRIRRQQAQRQVPQRLAAIGR